MTLEPEAAQPSSPRPRRRWGVAVQAIVLAVLLVLVFRFIDREQIVLAFRSVSLSSFVAFAAFMFSVRMIAAWRWLVVAREHFGLPRLTFGFLLRVELLADFAGIWLPSAIGGEAVRFWKIAERTGEKTRGPGSVVVDRFVGLVSLVLACAPFLVVLALQVPDLELPERFPVDLRWVVAVSAAALALGAVLARRYYEVLKGLARKFLDSALRSRFMVVPIVISLLGFVCMVFAHYLGFPELAERGWWVAGMIAVLPRLGRAVPLSIFGVTVVEGAMFGLGKLLEIRPEVILVVVALNLTVRYLGSLVGAVAELSLHGTRIFREIPSAPPKYEGVDPGARPPI